MAFGGNPVFRGKNFKSAVATVPPIPQSPYGTTQYGTAPYGTAQYRAQYGQPAMTPEQLDELYRSPAAGPAQTGRVTYDDVIVKTLACLGFVVVGAAVTLALPLGAALGLTALGAIGGFVLALVNTFKREPVPALILAYAALEGLFLGGLTRLLDAFSPGIGFQAVLGTFAVAGVTLLLYKSGRVRATPGLMRFFLIAVLGYLAFSVVNLFVMLFNPGLGAWGLRSSVHLFGIPLGVVVGLVAVVLAAISLVFDFDSIEKAVRAGAPRRVAWTAAFGLTVTLVWLYTEILRILAIFNSND
ncbi:Bax inhibitor-1/YccA family protein [Sinomonas sp. ASV322]|uniref:Bax inhibitor-1/YccA family protein n=1 Tax=Sinomonas sp. ASV322 TaxID=3041920 RepID=UPI0027DB08F1|nr:Bax inhibitor-1/YccA family protein [Sinomonas sp. ASV322]MDQ4503657.1 Bax inhibitor-1/YccA family protein [Sinomonas sp. ASV322]